MDISTLERLVKLNLFDFSNEYMDVYISERKVFISEVLDAYGKKVFESESNPCGWLIFVDLCNIANWSHPCEYLFISDDDSTILKKEAEWMPHADLKIRKVEVPV